MSILRALRRRTASELLRACEAMLLHLLVRTSLRFTTFARLQSFLERWICIAPPRTRSHPVARRRRTSSHAVAVCSVGDVTWAVGAAGRRIGGTTCLVDALVAFVMLRRRGHDPRIHIGVRQSRASAIEGHAWVECEGTVVIGDLPGMAGYARLA